MAKSPLFFQKSFFLRLVSQARGFNLIELLTAVAITGTLAVVGIKSYQAQTNKARAAEAKHSLSYVYAAEESFRDSWGTYHENLVAIGAIPSGRYHYDVGFGPAPADIKKDTDGDLDKYPLKDSLNVPACANFQQICAGTCLTNIQSAVRAIGGVDYSSYFSSGSINCEVVGQLHSVNTTTSKQVDLSAISGLTQSNLDATETTFKIIATEKLKTDDIWSIDQTKTITHEKDGTQ